MLLEVKSLKKYYPIRRGLFYTTVGWMRAVDGVSFDVRKGTTLGIVGESGCGKTTLARTIVCLLEADEGSIKFEGIEVTTLSPSRLRALRRDMQIIFQDPFNSLDPRFTVARIIQEGILNFAPEKAKKERLNLAKKILDDVGLPQDSLLRYPHEFSGGQRQRISIARSLIFNPKLLILDEPVSSLDVSIQAQIINLLLKVQEKLALTYIFIAHDLNVVQRLSDEVCVMYLGKIVERAPTAELFKSPLHPYTEALLSAIPTIGKAPKKRIILRGTVPSPRHLPSGCVFHTRCIYAQEKCKKEVPPLEQKGGRFFACHFPLA